jgi:hypothetical protein
MEVRMPVVTDSRILRAVPGGTRIGDAKYGAKCDVLAQDPPAPAVADSLQIRLVNVAGQPVGWISADAVDTTNNAVSGSLNRNEFADYCVFFEKDCLFSSLYLMAVAELRTQVRAPSAPGNAASALHGPFALTLTDWQYGTKIPGYPFSYTDADIDDFTAQINVFGAMAQTAQKKITDLRGGAPAFDALYLTQVVGASVANSILANPNQNVASLIAAGSSTDLAKDGVDKNTVLQNYSSLLGINQGSGIIAKLDADMQTAINTVSPTIAQAGGSTASSAPQQPVPAQTGQTTSQKIAWGGVVSADFKTKVCQIASNLGCDPNHLMAAMAFESEETFSPSIVNPRSGATGLIQFMPGPKGSAVALGTTTAALAKMSAIDQLSFVEKYLQPYRNKMHSLSDVYMTILFPIAVGKPESFVLFSSPSLAFRENSGLDVNHDGAVTKGEAASLVQAKLDKGLGGARLG